MLIASLGLHGLLLFIPTLNGRVPEAQPEEEEIEEISVVTLSQLPGTEPVVEEVAPATATAAPAAPPAGPVAPQLNASPPAATTSAPAAAPAEAPAFTQKPTEAAGGGGANQDSFADFPRYPGAQRGSFGLPADYDPFSDRTDDPVATVSQFFGQQLPGLGFAVQAVSSGGQRTVYLVSKGGAVQYLTLIPNASGPGTSILLSPQPLPDDLGGSSVVSPEELAFFANLPVPNPSGNDPSYQDIPEPQRLLAQPLAFYQDLGSTAGGSYIEPRRRAGVRRSVLFARQPDAQAVAADLQVRLQGAGYQVAPMATYGGGLLFQLTRSGFTGYLSIVPTTTGTGTAVFVWNRAPQ